MSTWEKMAPITGSHSGCLNCGPHPDTFPPEGVIAVGFGFAALTKDDEIKFVENGDMEFEDCWTGATAEALASKDPDHDWRIVLDGPRSGRTYQRHGAGEWTLIEKNAGFA